MTDISKFLTDVQKFVKRDRQNNSGKTSFARISKDVEKLFDRMAGIPGPLAENVFYYWENEYITSSETPDDEPTEEHLDKLAGMLAFLSGSDEFEESITEEDWRDLSDIVSDEADDLPIDILQDLMRILVSKNAY